MLKLILSFCLLLILALLILLKPLSKRRGIFLIIGVVLSLSSLLMYRVWGSGAQWFDYQQKTQRIAEAKALLKTFKGPSEVIERMKAHLAKQPNSAKGWFLLGRLYGAQKQFVLAENAFEKAYQLNPRGKNNTLHYLQLHYMNQNNVMDELSQTLLNRLLSNKPNDPDALNFLAMDAYNHNQFALAKKHWLKLVKVLPKGSEEQRAVMQALAQVKTKGEENVR